MSNPTPQPFLPDRSGRWTDFPRDPNSAQLPRASPRRHLLDMITKLSATERPPFDSEIGPTMTVGKGPCYPGGAASKGPFGSCGLGNLGFGVTDPSPIETDIEATAQLAAQRLPAWLDPDNPCFGLDPYDLVRFMAGAPAQVEPAVPFGPDSEVRQERKDIETQAEFKTTDSVEMDDPSRQAYLEMFPTSPPTSNTKAQGSNEKNCAELRAQLEDHEITLGQLNRPPPPLPVGPPLPPKDPIRCDRTTKLWERDCNKDGLTEVQKEICIDIVLENGIKHCNDPNFGPRPWKSKDEVENERLKESLKKSIDDVNKQLNERCGGNQGGGKGGGSKFDTDDEVMSLCIATLVSSLLDCLAPTTGTTVSCTRQRPITSCPPGEDCGPLICTCQGTVRASQPGAPVEFQTGNCPPECAAAKVAEVQGEVDCSGCKGSASWMSLVELCASTSDVDIFNSAGCGVIDPVPFFEVETSSTSPLPIAVATFQMFERNTANFTSFLSGDA